ncbi:hypothetical protein D3C78_1334850 [compost metagenome]
MLAIVFAGQTHDQCIIHRAQHRTAQQEGARLGVDVIQHFVYQIIRQMAGVQPGQALGGLLGGGGRLPGGQGDQLQRGGPTFNLIAQAAAVLRFHW